MPVRTQERETQTREPHTPRISASQLRLCSLLEEIRAAEHRWIRGEDEKLGHTRSPKKRSVQKDPPLGFPMIRPQARQSHRSSERSSFGFPNDSAAGQAESPKILAAHCHISSEPILCAFSYSLEQLNLGLRPNCPSGTQRLFAAYEPLALHGTIPNVLLA